MQHIFKDEDDPEIRRLDQSLRELQNETSNADWGSWHFSLLKLTGGEDLLQKIRNTLRSVPHHREPYNADPSSGAKTYISSWDLKNLKLEPITDLRSALIAKADEWSHYQGPTSDRKGNSDQFNELNIRFADQLIAYLATKEMKRVRLVQGIDTFYSFGGDHCGDDILIETEAGVYVVHFGFSS
jgi:hypothetical protein